MASDRNQFIKLYSIVMEEARHHERLCMEARIGGIFLTSVFIALLYFLSQALPQAPFLATTLFRWFMIIFGSIAIMTFYGVAMRHYVIAEACQQRAKKLEDILAGKTPGDTLKLTQEIQAMQEQKLCFLRSVFLRCWLFIPFLGAGLWIFLCLNLLKG